MAHDTSETRNRTILTGIVVSVLFLVAVKFVLDSYFVQITEATAKEKLASPEKLIAQREAEKKALTGGPVTIDVAMAEIARGRDVPQGVGQDITPRQSDDISAMTGWGKMPRTFTVAPVAEVNLFQAAATPLNAGAAEAGAGEAGTVAGDAGAPVAVDAATPAPAVAPPVIPAVIPTGVHVAPH
jgi:hypothetical protein